MNRLLKDVEAMPPPPPKRMKATQENGAGREVAPVSPERDAMMKRRKFGNASPTEAVRDPKKVKTSDPHLSPTTSTAGRKSMDPTVFASAYALASLALSPEHNPGAQQHHSPMSLQAREPDYGRMDGGEHYSLREPSSPHGPEAVPISPESLSPTRRKRRVQFANKIKTMRSIPGRVPHNRMRGTNRLMRVQGIPPFQQQQQRHSFWNPHAATLSPPWQPPPTMPPPMHHHGPPPLGGPPPLPPVDKEWVCDFCQVAAFATFEEACVHEAACRVRHLGPRDRKIQLQGQHFPLGKIHATHVQQQEHEPEDPSKWFTGHIALAVPSADAEWLSELNCFVREHCVEAYSASEEDIARASKRGRIVLNQVGIRCKFCVHRDAKDKAVAAVSYPTTVTGIYESVKRWQRVHQTACQDVPKETRHRLEELGNTTVWVPTTRQYWADSARALGMTDTHDGIRFECPPSVPANWKPDNHPESPNAGECNENAGAEAGFIALPSDKESVPEYVYFLMRQVESCKFTEADRFVARSKGPVGFAGFQCRHCSGHAGLGKYFPLTSKSLSTNSTSQNIHAHLLKCRKTPPMVKEELVRLKAEKGKAPRLVPGWRREFFDHVWERLHGVDAQK